MPENIQRLIDKIKTEGIESAEKRAKEVHDHAEKKSREIIAKAEKEAEKILARAKEDARRMEESSRLAVQQAARDALLSLRRSINEKLRRILAWSVKESLSHEDVFRLIETIARDVVGEKGEQDIRVILSEEDQKRIKKDVIAKLQNELKGSFEIEPSNDLRNGLMISFDGGKSSFEFTDTSLVEYLSPLLNEETAKMLKDSVIE